MPGINTKISINKDQSNEADCNFLMHSAGFSRKQLLLHRHIGSCLTLHDGYPFQSFVFGDCTITLLGMVYNMGAEELRQRLEKISGSLLDTPAAKTLIASFVKQADGDFIVQLYNDQVKKYCIFNDHLGRLPLYYRINDTEAVISSEIKYIHAHTPGISINKYGLAEYLLFGFHLHDHTNFSDIKRFRESHVAFITITGSGLSTDISPSAGLHFSLEAALPLKISYKKIVDAFSESVFNRVKQLEKNNFSLLSDLTGGYDSRTILAGLARHTSATRYFTFEYIRDESPVAEAVFNAFGKPGTFTKLKFNNQFTFDGISELVFKTDGLVDYYATQVCFNDVSYLRSQVKEKAARFGGLGGEFFRHPFKYYSVINGHPADMYDSLQFSNVASFLRIPVKDLRDHFSAYFDSYPEKDDDGRLKRFYYEYYRNQVGIAAEDRERIHFWTVHPMWSPRFLEVAFNQLPLGTVGYKYYIGFMKMLDERLLDTPIYDNPVNLRSRNSINAYELKYRGGFVRQRIKSAIRNIAPVKMFLDQLPSRKHYNANLPDDLAGRIGSQLSRLSDLKDLFTLYPVYRKKTSYFENLRQLTLLYYLAELELFKNKQ